VAGRNERKTHAAFSTSFDLVSVAGTERDVDEAATGNQLLDSADRNVGFGSFEKAGVYRTYVWVDPAKDLIGTILMQRNTGGAAADLADEVNIFMAMAAAAIDH
jgi:CubicO group peptidase (beta-lactamase class C family)